MSIPDGETTRLKILNLIERHGLTQQTLALRMGLNANTVTSSYIHYRRVPEPHVCLMLAGLSDEKDREFWLDASGLGEEQVALIGKAIGVPATAIGIDRMLDVVLNPQTRTERNAAEGIRALVDSRERKRKNGEGVQK